MSRFTKYFVFILCAILMASLFAGCAQKQEALPEDDTLHIYTSFYPLYAIAEMLMENIPDAQLHCLVQPQDGCLRDYQLSDWDLSLLTGSADMIIIGGRGLESFENLLFSFGEDGPAVAAVLYNLELAQPMLEGGDNGEDNHWQDDNPHLYMDPAGAVCIAESMAAQLMVADPANAAIYSENLESCNNRLRSVSGDSKQIMEKYAGEKVILMNETAVYSAETYALEAELCISRDSGEAYYDHELEKIIAQMQKCESRIILIEKQAPERFCEALEAAGYVLAKIDTMSARRAEEGAEGYLDALLENARSIAAAFESVKLD